MTSEFAAQAVRLHTRYLVEIVEELGLCPWAKRSRVERTMRQHASEAETLDAAVDDTLAFIRSLDAEGHVEVAFAIFPRLDVERRAFDVVATRVTEREAARHPLGEVPFMMAAFHPDALADTRTPERFIPYLRRTPDACIQLVRATALEAVRERTPQGKRLVDVATFDPNSPPDVPLRERIARTNLDTAHRLGLPELARRLAAIHADRDRTYAALRSARE